MDDARNIRINVEGDQLDSISLSDPSVSQTSTILAYRPEYQDYHGSNLGVLFVNIKEVFSCLNSLTYYEPVCSIFTREEDGFRKGRAFIEAADSGNDFDIFSGKPVWAVAVQDCPQFTNACFSNWMQFEVVCMLPRCECP